MGMLVNLILRTVFEPKCRKKQKETNCILRSVTVCVRWRMKWIRHTEDMGGDIG
jgi:hypothetical protein